MDIKLKNHLLQGKEVKQPGDIIKVSDEKGEKLIKKGFAEKVDNQDTENNESQTSETTETADVDMADTKTAKAKAKNKK